MSTWNSRSTELELLDLSSEHYTNQEYRDCLVKLDKIGQWLGGDRATFSAIKRLTKPPLSILDVGCGGGLFTMKLAKAYPQAQVTGIDTNPQAIGFAQEQCRTTQKTQDNIFFEVRNTAQLAELGKSYDIVLSTLVCHHLTDAELVDFIRQAVRLAKKRLILNDLHRHPAAFYLFKAISPVLFRNRLVQNDGPLSVKRAFTYADWRQYLTKAGINPSACRISWQPFFRWIVEIDCAGLYI